MAIEKNDKGQLLLDPVALAKGVAGENFSRRNGGWVKNVVGLDKTKTNGYSLLGDFLNQGLQWLSPGLYLDCSIGGSRKNHQYWYTLFTLDSDGQVSKVAELNRYTRDWAVRLWPSVEEALRKQYEVTASNAAPEAAEREKPVLLREASDEELIQELARRGYFIAGKEEKQAC